MTNAELITFLKTTKLFSSLNESVLKEILKKMEKIHLKKNKILYRQGSMSDSFYILVQGALLVTVKIEKNGQKFNHEVIPGETLGELGALSHEPRTGTVKAIEDSLLLKIPSRVFVEFSRDYPSISIDLINTLFVRSKEFINLISSGEIQRKHIAVIPTNNSFNSNPFLHELEKQLKQFADITLLSEQSTELQKEIEKSEKEKKTIIYLVQNPHSQLAKFCFKKIEMLYLVADGESEPHIESFILKKINENKYRIKPELVLFYKDQSQPRNTAKWLKLARFNLHHHIRTALLKDFQRLTRFIRGQAVGVVLGGGGLRSWAHLGALQALVKAEIPIDAIGGTSAGAIVAGFYALHESIEDSSHALEQLADITRETIALKNITWPAVSVFNGRDYTNKLKKMFKTKIEDLWLPFFCVSCDLSNNKQIIHRKGLVWKAIRTTTAVPAVFPPMVVKGKLYLDGGILNNLPVDVMKKIIGNSSTIAAVELTHNNIDLHEYNFPPILPFWKTFLAKMRFTYKDYKFPGLIDTFLKALLAGSSAKQNENSVMADILITPDLSRFSLLNVKKEQYQELIQLGYDEAVVAIATWKKKNKKKLE